MLVSVRSSMYCGKYQSYPPWHFQYG